MVPRAWSYPGPLVTAILANHPLETRRQSLRPITHDRLVIESDHEHWFHEIGGQRMAIVPEQEVEMGKGPFHGCLTARHFPQVKGNLASQGPWDSSPARINCGGPHQSTNPAFRWPEFARPHRRGKLLSEQMKMPDEIEGYRIDSQSVLEMCCQGIDHIQNMCPRVQTGTTVRPVGWKRPKPRKPAQIGVQDDVDQGKSDGQPS
jgi:hypothetical protein